MKNKEKFFTYLIALILILCIGTKLMSCNPSSSKNKIKENIEEVEEEKDEQEDTAQIEVNKIAQVTIFIMNNEKELSLTEEQIDIINKANDEAFKAVAEDMQQAINAFVSNKNYDFSKAKKKTMKQIDSYYATLKNILSKEMYNKCVSYSVEELEKLNSQKYIQKIKEFSEAFDETKKL